MSRTEAVAIIPAYNEQTTVGSVVRSALAAECIDHVVVVDDGSDDSTSLEASLAFESLGLPPSVFTLERHESNWGKTEALQKGVEIAKDIGQASLTTLVFLDADTSPIWSRETQANMKLWQSAARKLGGRNPLPQAVMDGRQDAFESLLARYIDEIAMPVLRRDAVMSAGMYERNTVLDTLLSVFDRSQNGGHAGNRAVSLHAWDGLAEACSEAGVELSGWEIEAALNEYLRAQPTTTMMMYGMVNVGSRVKTGGVIAGVRRMLQIHSQVFATRRKIKTLVS